MCPHKDPNCGNAICIEAVNHGSRKRRYQSRLQILVQPRRPQATRAEAKYQTKSAWRFKKKYIFTATRGIKNDDQTSNPTDPVGGYFTRQSTSGSGETRINPNDGSRPLRPRGMDANKADPLLQPGRDNPRSSGSKQSVRYRNRGRLSGGNRGNGARGS